MTHPMNSNPFPAAFVNFKGELQVWPISIPSSSSQCFVEWRMNLLTEQHAVGLMTQSMNDIMQMSLASTSTLSVCNIAKPGATPACVRSLHYVSHLQCCVHLNLGVHVCDCIM